MRIAGITIAALVASAGIACGSDDPTDAERAAALRMNTTTDAGDHRSDDASTHDADAGMPVSTNPLIAKLPGRWTQIEPTSGQHEVNVTVDPNDHTCARGQPLGDPGDACVHGFDPQGRFILTNDQLHARAPDNTGRADGQVLENGRRVEFDYTKELTTHFVFVKQ